MTDQQPHTPAPCDHHWKSYLQPKNVGLRWIRQCSQCGDFDTDNLREQVAAAEQRGAEKALNVFQEMADDIGEAIAFDVLTTPHGEAEYPVSHFREKLEEAIGQVSDDMELVPKDWLERIRANQIEGAKDE